MGYNDALTLAAKKLADMPPEEVCDACGARYQNGDYYLAWFNIVKNVSAVSGVQKILMLHYLTANGAKNISGRLIAYREAAPALFYEPNFYKRAVSPLVNFFAGEPENLITTGELLGGVKAAIGDSSVTVNVLPYVPLTFVIWDGGGEFPPDGGILFDQTAKTWFKPEDLAVLAGEAVYELINTFKNKHKIKEERYG